MATEPKTEIWNKTGSGVLTEIPLLLTACMEGKFGTAFSYPGGCVYQALFTYLTGKPDEGFFSAHPELFYGSWLVCLSAEWENYLRKLPMQAVFRREVMEPLCAESVKPLKPLPEGYILTPFTPAIFEAHPFGHGGNYAGFEDFSERGAGAAVLYNGQVVAAASSFLTFEDQAELDICTDTPEAGACGSLHDGNNEPVQQEGTDHPLGRTEQDIGRAGKRPWLPVPD